MGGLVLGLKPYERVLIGGVVVQNGAKKASLRIADDAAGVLRLSDALHPDDARTPLTRAYLAAQSLVIGHGTPEGRDVLAGLLADAAHAYEGFAFAAPLGAARAAGEDGAWFRVLRLLKPLLPQEAALLHDPRFRARTDEGAGPADAGVFRSLPRELLTAHQP